MSAPKIQTKWSLGMQLCTKTIVQGPNECPDDSRVAAVVQRHLLKKAYIRVIITQASIMTSVYCVHLGYCEPGLMLNTG